MTDEDKKLIYTFFVLKEGSHGWWYHPDKPTQPIHPDLAKIQTYFEYAVPKLEEKLGYTEYFKFLVNWVIDFTGQDKDPGEVYGQALLRLIKEEW